MQIQMYNLIKIWKLSREIPRIIYINVVTYGFCCVKWDAFYYMYKATEYDKYCLNSVC